jgi:hypothetical protein
VNTKVVIAVLVGVVVLFVVAVVIGGRDRDGDASARQEGPLGSLLESAEGQSDVPVSELSGPCLQPGGLLAVQNGCALQVAASDERLRTVRLTVLANDVTVSAPAPDPEGESQRELKKTLGLNEKLTVAIGPDGAVIALSCFSCQLRLGG